MGSIHLQYCFGNVSKVLTFRQCERNMEYVPFGVVEMVSPQVERTERLAPLGGHTGGCRRQAGGRQGLTLNCFFFLSYFCLGMCIQVIPCRWSLVLQDIGCRNVHCAVKYRVFVNIGINCL